MEHNLDENNNNNNKNLYIFLDYILPFELHRKSLQNFDFSSKAMQHAKNTDIWSLYIGKNKTTYWSSGAIETGQSFSPKDAVFLMMIAGDTVLGRCPYIPATLPRHSLPPLGSHHLAGIYEL